MADPINFTPIPPGVYLIRLWGIWAPTVPKGVSYVKALRFSVVDALGEQIEGDWYNADAFDRKTANGFDETPMWRMVENHINGFIYSSDELINGIWRAKVGPTGLVEEYIEFLGFVDKEGYAASGKVV